MAVFPNIRSFMPSYGMGSFAVEATESNEAFRYLWSSRIVGQPLTLPFNPISTADKDLIVSHYAEHCLGKSFQVPADMFCYITGGNLILPASKLFRYATPISIQRIGVGWWSCSVSLVTI